MDGSESDHAEQNQGLHRQIMGDLCSYKILQSVEW